MSTSCLLLRLTVRLLSFEFCATLLFTYDISDRIMVIFVFYGYLARARCKIFVYATYRWDVMAVFAPPIQPEMAPAYLYCSVK